LSLLSTESMYVNVRPLYQTAIKPVTVGCFKALSQSEKFARTLMRH
jgi:hypothetical protein